MGDKLVGNILNIFSEKSNCEFITGDGKKKTRFVTFYSPCGGAGTSTLAAGVSVKCVQSGLNAFYLNFEKIAATTAYLMPMAVEKIFRMFCFSSRRIIKTWRLK